MENEYDLIFKREEIWLWIQRARGKAAKAGKHKIYFTIIKT